MRYVIFVLCLNMSLLAEQRYLSPSDIAISEDGSILYLACATDSSIQLFDIEKEKVSSRFKAEGVREIALSHEETRLYAACGDFAGRLLELDAKIFNHHFLIFTISMSVKPVFSIYHFFTVQKCLALLSPFFTFLPMILVKSTFLVSGLSDPPLYSSKAPSI